MPELASHERSRNVKQKAPVGKRSRQAAAHVTKQTSVSLRKRLQEFPNTGLTISAGKLFCLPCKIKLDNIKSSTADHVNRTKHKTNIDTFIKAQGADGLMKEQLTAYFKDHLDEKNSSSDANLHVIRYRSVEAFLATGTPVDRIDVFRPLLERSGLSLMDSSHLRSTYIPQIEKMEIDRLKAECSGQFIASPYDGTTRLGEMIAQTGRWCTSDFQLCTRLLVIKTTKAHVNHAELASLLTS